MGRILIKDLKTPSIFALIVMVPLFLFWNIKNAAEIFPIAVFVQISFTFVITILTVMLNEQYEDINNGYRFYQILPIKKWNITLVKFFTPIIVVIFLGLVNRGIYSVFSAGNEALILSDHITIVFSVFFVLNSGLIFIGIYLLGYTKFIQFTSGLLTLFVFGSFLTFKLFRFGSTKLGDIANAVEKWLISGDHILFLIVGSIIYIILFFIANAIEKK
ncbi:MAG: hypothetical protein KAS21_07910 [Candidatus Aminicenantes bacterium]|nr:hypothetical protein [Candidatus Aminicenantes bacterium]MCK5004998.1 hypothetical protein [Candidatus Aminicenantes bacterium]